MLLPPDPSRSRWLLIPPPPLFAVVFVLGMQIMRVAPLPLAPASLQPVARGVGLLLIAVAGVLVASAVALFLARWTTIIPHASASSLVAAGPFRFTRNPMYLGLTTAYLGVALTLNALWPLLFLALPLWVMQTRVIPFEEQTMRRVFGAAYADYQRRTGRWITLPSSRKPAAIVPSR